MISKKGGVSPPSAIILLKGIKNVSFHYTFHARISLSPGTSTLALVSRIIRPFQPYDIVRTQRRLVSVLLQRAQGNHDNTC